MTVICGKITYINIIKIVLTLIFVLFVSSTQWTCRNRNPPPQLTEHSPHSPTCHLKKNYELYTMQSYAQDSKKIISPCKLAHITDRPLIHHPGQFPTSRLLKQRFCHQTSKE